MHTKSSKIKRMTIMATIGLSAAALAGDAGSGKAIDLVPYGCTVLRKTCFETTAGILDDKKAK